MSAMTDAGIPMGEGREREVLLDPSTSWQEVIEALFALKDPSEIEVELAASQATLARWRTGRQAPRPLTQKLLRRSLCDWLGLAFADTPPPAAAGDRALAVERAFQGVGMDRAGVQRWAAITAEHLGHDMVHINSNSLRRLIATIDALECLALRTPEPNSGGEVLAEREACAAIADKWAAENRMARDKARTRERKMMDAGFDTPEMADMLDGAAIECNAIAHAIRQRGQ